VRKAPASPPSVRTDDRVDVPSAGREPRPYARVCESSARGSGLRWPGGSASELCLVDNAEPETSAADRVTVLEQVALNGACIMEVQGRWPGREIFEARATASPRNPRMVARQPSRRQVRMAQSWHADLISNRGQVE